MLESSICLLLRNNICLTDNTFSNRLIGNLHGECRIHFIGFSRISDRDTLFTLLNFRRITNNNCRTLVCRFRDFQDSHIKICIKLIENNFRCDFIFCIKVHVDIITIIHMAGDYVTVCYKILNLFVRITNCIGRTISNIITVRTDTSDKSNRILIFLCAERIINILAIKCFRFHLSSLLSSVSPWSESLECHKSRTRNAKCENDHHNSSNPFHTKPPNLRTAKTIAV